MSTDPVTGPTQPDATSHLTRVHLTRTASGRVRVVSGGGVFRVMLLARTGDGAVVQLVPGRALLLAGDDVAVEFVVDAGLRLEVGETGGTVAYDMRGGQARWRSTYRVAPAATLVHHTLPWVSAAGSRVDRSTDVHLEGDGRLLLRETLVLGRHGEEPGSLVTRTRVERDGHEVLVEELHSADLTAGPGTERRVLDQVFSFGPAQRVAQDDGTPGGLTRLDLGSGDTVWRRIDDHAHSGAAELDRVVLSLAQAGAARV